MLLWSAVAVWSAIRLYICFTNHSIGRIADLLIRNHVPCPIELYQLIHGNSQATHSSPTRSPVSIYALLAEVFAARVVLACTPSRIVAYTYLHDNGARGYLLAMITSSGGAVISSRAQRRDETLDIST